MKAPNTYLVTGAAGFIGYHVAKRLLDEGHAVVGVDNLNDYYDPCLKRDRLAQLDGRDGFSFERLNVADRAAMETLFREASFNRVIHLAAQVGVRFSVDKPHAYVQSNLLGFANVLEGCRHGEVEHLVYASSSSVYGANTLMPFSTRHNVDHPISLYAATKKANELMAHTYSHLSRLPDFSGLVATEPQKAQRGRFRDAAFYGRMVMDDPDARAFYRDLAERREQPIFSVVVGDYLNPPEVQAIDATAYTGATGDPIGVRAFDDVEVTQVLVTLTDTDGDVELETGPAVLDLQGWRYEAQTDVAAGTTVRITARALDRPGGVGEDEVEVTLA